MEMYCAAMKRNLAANTPRCKSAVLRSSMFLIYMELRVGRGSLHTTGTVTKTAGGDSSTCLKGHGLTVHSLHLLFRIGWKRKRWPRHTAACEDLSGIKQWTKRCTKHASPMGNSKYGMQLIYIYTHTRCLRPEQKAGCRWCKRVICFHYSQEVPWLEHFRYKRNNKKKKK